MSTLADALEGVKSSGRKALVPYFVGGLSDDWCDAVRAAVHAGADAVEIGIPFSDPIMDGPVIQRAANQALAREVTPSSVLDDIARADVSVPLIAMTYYNVFHHRGLQRAAADLQAAGVCGAIVPDLALEESEPWRQCASEHDVASIMMVAPSTSRARVVDLATASRGFVYAAARMAVTGVSRDTGDAARVVKEIRLSTTMPIYVGIGISSSDLAARACLDADGVIVGTALVQRLLDGGGAREVEQFVGELRRAID